MSPVTRDTSSDAMAEALEMSNAISAAYRGIRRDQCPYPPGTREHRKWLAEYDAAIVEALSDLASSRGQVSSHRAQRVAMEEAARCLAACERTIKATALRRRCQSSREALERLLNQSGGGVVATGQEHASGIDQRRTSGTAPPAA